MAIWPFRTCYDNNNIVERRAAFMSVQTLSQYIAVYLCKLPTLYWLPKLHKRLYKSRFIANSSACITTELSICLTFCLIEIKKTMSLNIAQPFMNGIVKICLVF